MHFKLRLKRYPNIITFCENARLNYWIRRRSNVITLIKSIGFEVRQLQALENGHYHYSFLVIDRSDRCQLNRSHEHRLPEILTTGQKIKEKTSHNHALKCALPAIKLLALQSPHTSGDTSFFGKAEKRLEKSGASPRRCTPSAGGSDFRLRNPSDPEIAYRIKNLRFRSRSQPQRRKRYVKVKSC